MKANGKRCPQCRSRKAERHPIYGIINCKICRDNNIDLSPLPKPPEMTSQTVKEERDKYARSIVQPYRNGVLSKEYLDMYGTKGINPSDKDIKGAKNVWTGDVISPNMELDKTK